MKKVGQKHLFTNNNYTVGQRHKNVNLVIFGCLRYILFYLQKLIQNNFEKSKFILI